MMKGHLGDKKRFKVRWSERYESSDGHLVLPVPVVRTCVRYVRACGANTWCCGPMSTLRKCPLCPPSPWTARAPARPIGGDFARIIEGDRAGVVMNSSKTKQSEGPLSIRPPQPRGVPDSKRVSPGTPH